MCNRSQFLTVLVCALFGTVCSAKTVVSVGNPDPRFAGGLLLSEQEALSVSWTESQSYTGVSISVPLSQGGSTYANPVYAFLTDRLGPGMTAADVIAKSTAYFTPALDPMVQVFGNLNLGPGTYYLTLWSPVRDGGGWLFSTNPSTIVDEGSMVGASQYAYNPIGFDRLAVGLPYLPSGLPVPAADYVNTYSNEHLVFSVTGTAVSSAPEPGSIWLIGIAGALIGLHLYKTDRRNS